MKVQLKRNVIYLLAGLMVFSYFTFWISQNLLVVTEEKAIQVAVSHLAKNDITVDPTNTNAGFLRGKWFVFFLVDPSVRPAHILVRISPITGNAEIIPLK